MLAVSGTVAISGLDFIQNGDLIGGRISRTNGRETEFHVSVEGDVDSYPMVTEVVYDVQGQITSLTLDTFKDPTR